MTRIRWCTGLFLLLVHLLPLGAHAQLGPRSGDSALAGSQQRPLPVEQAFPWFVSIDGPGRVSVTWQPAPEHYLYRHQFHFTLLPGNDGPPFSLAFELPDGVQKTDEFFGDIEAYYGPVKASLQLDPGLIPGARLEIRFQGCADWGFCYQPHQVIVPLQP